MQIFTLITLAVSQARHPTLCWTLPLINRMRSKLQAYIDDPVLPPGLREAAASGMEKLEAYSTLACASQYTILATGKNTHRPATFG